MSLSHRGDFLPQQEAIHPILNDACPIFFFLIRHYLKQRMWKATAVVLGRHNRIASSLDQFERQIFSDIKIFHNRENCRAFCTSLPKNSMMNAPDLMQKSEREKPKNIRITIFNNQKDRIGTMNVNRLQVS